MSADYTLKIYQGATLAETFTLYDNGVARDLTGYSARAKVRLGVYTEGAALLTLTCTVTPLAGEIEVTATAAETAVLDFHRGVWDLEIYTVAGAVERIAGGVCELHREVTK